MGGDEYGASLAASSSSGANLSGATDSSGGGVYGGTTYGAGSLLLTKTDQRGSIGASSGGLPWTGVAAIVVGIIFLLRR